MLDTSRFRQLLAQRFNVAAHHVHGFVYCPLAVMNGVRHHKLWCLTPACYHLRTNRCDKEL